MSLNHSPEIVRLLMSERIREAEANRLAANSRSRGRHQWSVPVRRLVGLRPASSPIAQTCSC
jgi:hypothetical protein